MYKRILSLIVTTALCLSLTACGMPKEKIAQAQEKYARLAEIHNQVVEAHKNVEDNSLDEELTALRSRASDMGAFNLAEMAEEEIDKLIQDIDSMINEYEGYLAQLSNIKGEEEDAVLTPIVITLMNGTDISFSDLRLYEQGSNGLQVNVLEDLELFVPGQYLAGLTVMRDVDNTPWVLTLADENETGYETVLAVGEFTEESVSLTLHYDSSTGELVAERTESGEEANPDGTEGDEPEGGADGQAETGTDDGAGSDESGSGGQQGEAAGAEDGSGGQQGE